MLGGTQTEFVKNWTKENTRAGLLYEDIRELKKTGLPISSNSIEFDAIQTKYKSVIYPYASVAGSLGLFAGSR